MSITQSLHTPAAGTTGLEWKDYSLKSSAGRPLQWDELTGAVEGFWADPKAAITALTGKKITLPGMTSGYGFFIDGGDLTAGWAPGGRVRAEFTAPGLFARKVKLLKGSIADSYSLTNITTNAISGLPNATYGKLNYRNTRRVYDVQVAWLASTGSDLLDLANVGEPITSHWAATAAGLALGAAPEANPFASNADAECTFHYPRKWSYEVLPGDRTGPENGGMAQATFRFIYTHEKTL